MRDLTSHNMVSSVFLVACRFILVAARVILVPRSGIEPGPPALGVWSLSHWITREVPGMETEDKNAVHHSVVSKMIEVHKEV